MMNNTPNQQKLKLQQIDPDCEEIIANSPLVTAYLLNATYTPLKWSEMGIQGNCTLYSRNEDHPYRILLLNKSSKTDLLITIAQPLHLEVQNNFLMLGYSKQCMCVGLYFHKGIASEFKKSLSNILLEIPQSLKADSTDEFKSLPQAQYLLIFIYILYSVESICEGIYLIDFEGNIKTQTTKQYRSTTQLSSKPIY